MGWEQRKPTAEEWAKAEKESEERKAKESAESTMQEKAKEADVSPEQQTLAREARGEAQRVLDEKAVEDQMKAIDALGESPLDELAEEAKKDDQNGKEQAA